MVWNDDPYALPAATLKRARRVIKKGVSREEVARAVLDGMRRAAQINPRLLTKIGYLKEHPAEALLILEVRLRLCDPSCNEHKDYSKTIERLRWRRNHQKNKKRRREDPEWRRAQNAYETERRRKKRAEDPVYEERMRASWREHAARRGRDPAYRAKRAEYERERRRTDPEYREQERQRTRERRARQREAKKAEI